MDLLDQESLPKRLRIHWLDQKSARKIEKKSKKRNSWYRVCIAFQLLRLSSYYHCWSLKLIFAIPSARFGIRIGGAGSEIISFSSLNRWKSHKSRRNVYVAIAVPYHPQNLSPTYIKHKNIVRIECWSRNRVSGSGTASKSSVESRNMGCGSEAQILILYEKTWFHKKTTWEHAYFRRR